MVQRDYYIGPTLDVTSNGVPTICTNQDLCRKDDWHATAPGDRTLLVTIEGTDISETFLTSWTKYSKTDILILLQTLSEGFYDPDAPQGP